jgi:hypothetical protein
MEGHLLTFDLVVCCADAWQKRWQKSSWKQSEGSAGDFKHTTGKWYGDAKGRSQYPR